VLGIKSEKKKRTSKPVLSPSLKSLTIDDILAVGSMNQVETTLLTEQLDLHPDLKGKMPGVDNVG
jgi:hypothetical protein